MEFGTEDLMGMNPAGDATVVTGVLVVNSVVKLVVLLCFLSAESCPAGSLRTYCNCGRRQRCGRIKECGGEGIRVLCERDGPIKVSRIRPSASTNSPTRTL